MSYAPDSPKIDHVHSSFGRKQVYILNCGYCGEEVCIRAMRAVLIADTNTELYSTDCENGSIDVTDEKYYATGSCDCLIENMACLACGNIVGYHVRVPCIPCLSSCNNGHYWMFFSQAVKPTPRLDDTGECFLQWGDLQDFKSDHIKDMLADECYR